MRCQINSSINWSYICQDVISNHDFRSEWPGQTPPKFCCFSQSLRHILVYNLLVTSSRYKEPESPRLLLHLQPNILWPVTFLFLTHKNCWYLSRDSFKSLSPEIIAWFYFIIPEIVLSIFILFFKSFINLVYYLYGSSLSFLNRQ